MGKPLKDFRKYYLEIILSMCLFLKLADKFPPLHLNINSFAKSFLNRHFQTWYSDEIRKKTDVGENVYEVHGNTRLLRMKPTQSC